MPMQVHLNTQAKKSASEGMLSNEDDMPLIFPLYSRLLWLCAFMELLSGLLLFVFGPYSLEVMYTLKHTLKHIKNNLKIY